MVETAATYRALRCGASSAARPVSRLAVGFDGGRDVQGLGGGIVGRAYR
jgi:hypothetical protein